MKTVIYSTNTNEFEKKDFIIEQSPRCAEYFNKCTQKYTSSEIILALKQPGTFLLDLNLEKDSKYPENLKIYFLKGKSAEEIAVEIIGLKPDLAVQATPWIEPLDWLPLQDCLIAEILSEKGIKTSGHSVKTAMTCFDKRRSRDFLLANGFNAAKSVYIHHELFRIERGRPEIINNPYQELVFSRIKKMRFPLIIKDTFGLSSFGMDVVKTFPMAKNILISKKNSGDRLAEEFLDGPQFGTEIHGTPGNYTIFPPFMFSTNQYGITSPKQSVKIGPVLNEKYNLKEFYRTMNLLAEKLELNGIAQVDLVFHEKKWYVIEINPRLSGLTPAISSSAGKSIPELLLDAASGRNEKNPEMKYVADIKFPVVSSEMQKKLYEADGVLFVRQMLNKKARQRREEGFCEVVLGGRNSIQELKADLENLNKNFQEIIEPSFYKKALEMLKEINSGA